MDTELFAYLNFSIAIIKIREEERIILACTLSPVHMSSFAKYTMKSVQMTEVIQGSKKMLFQSSNDWCFTKATAWHSIEEPSWAWPDIPTHKIAKISHKS